MQLVFSGEETINIKHPADWNRLKKRKQQLIKQCIIQNNARRIKHTYNVGDKVSLKADPRDLKFDKKYLETYPVV